MKYPKIGEEINRMAAEDQEVRQKFYSQKEGTFAEIVKPVDDKNHFRMVQIVDEIGYPTITKVGKKASFNAWLIIQHHSDLNFQKKCLSMMEENKSDLNLQNIAYLKDRVLMNTGRKQIYGTQLKLNPVTKKMELYEVEDSEHLDERRASVGLESIKSYLQQF